MEQSPEGGNSTSSAVNTRAVMFRSEACNWASVPGGVVCFPAFNALFVRGEELLTKRSAVYGLDDLWRQFCNCSWRAYRFPASSLRDSTKNN